jgi:glycerol-3-phosphate dehydrogenase (NAD(P)+)
MGKIVTIGAGAMGTAFAYPCSDNKHDVGIVGTHLENNAIDELNKNRFHPGLNLEVLKTIKFFKHESIKEVFKTKPNLIVLGVSSKGIDWIAEELKKISYDGELPNLLMLTKGLSMNGKQYELLVDKLHRLLSDKGIKNINLSAVGGPCLAAGLANRIHSGVVIANKNLDTAKSLSKMIATDYYHVSTSIDINGVEVCAAIKNIFSMAIGAAAGLNKTKPRGNLHLNTAATLVKQSVYEMEVFTEFLKGKKETAKGLAGLGDLYVSIAGGRNSKMGALIGEGIVFSEAKKNKMSNVTVEGAELIFEIGKKVKEDFDEKKLPLMIAMINAILEDKKLEIKWENFN